MSISPQDAGPAAGQRRTFVLIPGAGGTVSVTKRIGRHRAAWLALTGARIDVDTALGWGLVDERC